MNPLQTLSTWFASKRTSRRKWASALPRVVCHAEVLEDRRLLSATQLVEDINQQAPAISYGHGIVLDGVLYFAGRSREAEPTSRNSFWSYDPQANSGNGQLSYLGGDEVGLENPGKFVIVDGKIFFAAGSGSLWQYDPTAADGAGELTKLTDILVDRASDAVAVGGSLYFRTSDFEGNFGLVRYQVAEQKTTVVWTMSNSIHPSDKLVVADGKVYFYLVAPAEAFQLWQFDPAAGEAGTLSMVVNNLKHYTSEPNLAAVGGKVYFSADDGIHGMELWSYDPEGNGGTGSTSLVSDVYVGAGDADPSDFVVFDGKLYLRMRNGQTSPMLWSVDPSLDNAMGGIELVSDELLWDTAVQFHASGDSLYFLARADFRNWAMWRYTPTPEGSSLPAKLEMVGPKVAMSDVDLNASLPQHAVALGDAIALRIDDRLWIYRPESNGGDGSIVPVPDISGATKSSSPRSYIALGDEIYFVANDGIHGAELWRYRPNATPEERGPELVSDLFVGASSSSPTNLTVFGNRLIFRATTADGLQLFQFDKTTGVVTILANLSDSISDRWIIDEGKLYFSRIVQDHVELVFVDLMAPSGSGSIEFAGVLPADVQQHPAYFAAAGGKLYFDGIDSTGLAGLYQYNPLANGGLGLIARVTAYAGGQVLPTSLVSLAGRVYFRGYDTEHGWEIWGYDPEANDGEGSARRITDTPSSETFDPTPDQMTVVGDVLYYKVAAHGPNASFQLWRYDPHANAGSGNLSQVVELDGYWRGILDLLPNDHPLAFDEGMIYFSVLSPAGQYEVWQYNTGTTGQPELAPVVATKNGLDLQQLLPFGGKLYFNSSAAPLGTEMHVANDLSSSTWVQFAFASEPSIAAGTVRAESHPTSPVLHEWDDATGQVWMTLGDDRPTGPFNLSIRLRVDNPAFADLQVQSHLGESVHINLETVDGVRFYKLSLANLDLSNYEPGDQVLLADVRFLLNDETASWISMQGEDAYPQPTANHGVSVISAENRSSDEAILYDRHVPGQFEPMVYDANDDGRVGLADFAQFVSNFGRTVNATDPDTYRFDYNRDGKIGLADFALFVSKFGQRKPTSVASSFSSGRIEGEPITTSSVGPTDANPFTQWHVLSDMMATDLTLSTNSVVSPDAEEAIEPTAIETAMLFYRTQPPWDPKIIDAILQADEQIEVAADRIRVSHSLSDRRL